MIADAAITGASVHIVHINSMANGKTPEALKMIEGARAHGLDITTEAYPYIAGATRLESSVFNPGWQEQLGITYSDLMWVEYRRTPDGGIVQPLSQARRFSHPLHQYRGDGARRHVRTLS